MSMPIPSVLESQLPQDSGARENIRLFEEIVSRLEVAFKSEISWDFEEAMSFVPLIASWLLGNLQRVRITSWGFISALNAPNEMLFVLTIRNLVESAANLAYVEQNLRDLGSRVISKPDMDAIALRMKFATRSTTFTDEELKKIKAVNVLTTIPYFDEFLVNEMEWPFSKRMVDAYAWLSEYCHPNFSGTSQGIMLHEKARETFETEPTIRTNILVLGSGFAKIALHGFCLLYNRCWKQLLSSGEKLPEWNPAGDPRIPKPAGFD